MMAGENEPSENAPGNRGEITAEPPLHGERGTHGKHGKHGEYGNRGKYRAAEVPFRWTPSRTRLFLDAVAVDGAVHRRLGAGAGGRGGSSELHQYRGGVVVDLAPGERRALRIRRLGSAYLRDRRPRS